MQRKGKESVAGGGGEEDGGAEQFEVIRGSRRFMDQAHNPRIALPMGETCCCGMNSAWHEHQRPPPDQAIIPAQRRRRRQLQQEGDRRARAAHQHKRVNNLLVPKCVCCRCMAGVMPTWQGERALSWQGLHTCHQHYDYHLPPPVHDDRGPAGPVLHGTPGVAAGSSLAQSNDLFLWKDDYYYANSPPPYLGPHYCPVPPTPPCIPLSQRFHHAAAPALQNEVANNEGDEDLYAVSASRPVPPKTKKKRAPPPRNYNKKLVIPPFPSSHGLPCVLCHFCCRLLLLPPGTTPHVTSPFVKLKCGYCLNVSKFSARHLHRETSSTLQSAAGPPALCVEFPALRLSSCDAAATHKMPSCDTLHAMRVGDTPEPPSGNCGLTLDPNEIGYATKQQSPEQNGCEGGETPNSACEGNGVDYAVNELLGAENTESGGGETPKTIGENMSGLNIGTESMANTQDNRHELASQETTAATSSVQDWVDSHTLETECGSSDVQLQQCHDQQDTCHEEIEQLDTHSQQQHRHRPPLHTHFGYKDPLELFEKAFSSEDDEIKARSETHSFASSSSSSVNASHGKTSFKCASFNGQSSSMQGVRGANVRDNTGAPQRNFKAELEDAQRSVVGILKRGLRDITIKSGRSSLKARVIVNGHMLSDSAIKQAEERAGKLRPGSYWYDCKAGFWGVDGGPCRGILPPFIEELSYPLLSNCSNGDTQVYVNGRELHSKDLTLLSQRGLSRKPGRAYALGFDGVLVDDTTGLELKPLGKLAPTVEYKGKGFGMFAVDVIQRKTRDAHQIKPANPGD